jgi:aminoglycoside phosphotransferase (APT) family kinase protein
MGCYDRRPDKLVEKFGELANSQEVSAAMKEEELKRLATLGSRLPGLINDLNTYNLPETLVHGDFHGGNVAGEDGKMVFFDWSDASIAHPFFDMIDILQEKDEEVQFRLRDHYLSQWIDYEPMERLQEAWQIASILTAINQAISYQSIVANIEPAECHELDWGMAFWMQRALDLFEDNGDFYG